MSTGAKIIIWIIVIALVAWGGYEFLKPPTSVQNSASVGSYNAPTIDTTTTSAPMISATTSPSSALPTSAAKG